MFPQRRLLWADRALPLLAPDGESGGGGGETTTQKTESAGDDLDKIEGLGDKGKEAIRKERDAAKAARDEAKALKEERDALQQEKADREAAESKARDEEARKKGEFAQLADQRGRDLDTAKADNKTLKADNDALREAINGFLDAEWKALPDTIKAAYLGADDDPLAKLRFLPRGKALAEELVGSKDPAKRGAGPDPKPKGPDGLPSAAQVADEMRRNRGYPVRAGGS
jgi:hypothetical protein